MQDDEETERQPERKPLPTMETLFDGPFRCPGTGAAHRCGIPLQHWGKCQSCYDATNADWPASEPVYGTPEYAQAQHEVRLRAARETIPERFRWASFAGGAQAMLDQLTDLDLRHRMTAAGVRLVGSIKSPLPRSIVLRGDTGAGKTTLACALLRRVHDLAKWSSPSSEVDIARRARFVQATELDEAFTRLQGWGKPDLEAAKVIETAIRASILVVDNVEPGALKSGVGKVVWERHNKSRPSTIVTTWMSESEAAKSGYGAGWARRAYETTVELPVRQALRAVGS